MMVSVSCCKCGHVWKTRSKSYGHPKWCPNCKSPHWDDGVTKKEYTFNRETRKINLSDRTYEQLIRAGWIPRTNTQTSTVEELLQTPSISKTISYNITYKGKLTPLNHSIRVSKEAYEKLCELKKEHSITRIDEVLWHVMHNTENR